MYFFVYMYEFIKNKKILICFNLFISFIIETIWNKSFTDQNKHNLNHEIINVKKNNTNKSKLNKVSSVLVIAIDYVYYRYVLRLHTTKIISTFLYKALFIQNSVFNLNSFVNSHV